MSVTVTPLSQALGAEISGVDVAHLNDSDFAEIRAAWHAHKVLLIRGQRLDTAAQTAFARRFGDIQVVRSAAHILGEQQPVMHVSNRLVDGKPGVLPDGEMQFHTDQCYYEKPSRMTMLFALEIPKQGGNTLFLNAAAAFAALPKARQAELSRFHVKQVYDYDGAPTVKTGDIRDDAPHFVHPLVIRHPETGVPVLYANRLMSERIVELDRDASDKLLAELFDHMEQRRFIYEHTWRVGDLVMWDNLAVMHARTDFDPAEARILRRCTVAGERPQPAA
jgi:taurine dioxygenase